MKYLTIVIEYEDGKEPVHPLIKVHDELLSGEVIGWRRTNAIDELSQVVDKIEAWIEADDCSLSSHEVLCLLLKEFK